MFTDPGCRSERTAELVVAPGYCTARPVSAWALLAQASEELLQVPGAADGLGPRELELAEGGGGGGGAGMALA